MKRFRVVAAQTHRTASQLDGAAVSMTSQTQRIRERVRAFAN